MFNVTLLLYLLFHWNNSLSYLVLFHLPTPTSPLLLSLSHLSWHSADIIIILLVCDYLPLPPWGPWATKQDAGQYSQCVGCLCTLCVSLDGLNSLCSHQAHIRFMHTKIIPSIWGFLSDLSLAESVSVSCLWGFPFLGGNAPTLSTFTWDFQMAAWPQNCVN